MTNLKNIKIKTLLLGGGAILLSQGQVSTLAVESTETISFGAYSTLNILKDGADSSSSVGLGLYSKGSLLKGNALNNFIISAGISKHINNRVIDNKDSILNIDYALRRSTSFDLSLLVTAYKFDINPKLSLSFDAGLVFKLSNAKVEPLRKYEEQSRGQKSLRFSHNADVKFKPFVIDVAPIVVNIANDSTLGGFGYDYVKLNDGLLTDGHMTYDVHNYKTERALDVLGVYINPNTDISMVKWHKGVSQGSKFTVSDGGLDYQPINHQTAKVYYTKVNKIHNYAWFRSNEELKTHFIGGALSARLEYAFSDFLTISTFAKLNVMKGYNMLEQTNQKAVFQECPDVDTHEVLSELRDTGQLVNKIEIDLPDSAKTAYRNFMASKSIEFIKGPEQYKLRQGIITNNGKDDPVTSYSVSYRTLEKKPGTGQGITVTNLEHDEAYVSLRELSGSFGRKNVDNYKIRNYYAVKLSESSYQKALYSTTQQQIFDALRSVSPREISLEDNIYSGYSVVKSKFKDGLQMEFEIGVSAGIKI